MFLRVTLIYIGENLMSSYALVPIVLGVIGLLAALIVYRAVLSFPEGTGKVVDIANQIHRGALVFMRREYIYLIICFNLY